MSELPGPDGIDWNAARTCLGTGGILSVVMPCHNLGDVIEANIRQVVETFRDRLPFEIVAVDDGSDDHTLERLRVAETSCPELRVIALFPNQGKGHALRAGTEAATGNWILFLDADLDLPPYQVGWFFERIQRRKADVVIGAKRHPRSELVYPRSRRILSAGYYLIVRLMFGLPLRDTQTGIKLFRREVLDAVLPRMLVKRFACDLELLVIANHLGFRIAEAPVILLYQGVAYGCVSAATVRKIIHDTLAVFYRYRILRYYQSITMIEPPDPLPAVSVVIACPVPSAYLDECLRGLMAQTCRPLEVLILPDTATGRQWPDGVREIATGARRPAEKRNRGIREARGEIVAFLDDDAVPVSDWLAMAMRYFGDRQVAAVGGPGVTPPGEPLMAAIGGQVYANALVSGGYRLRYTPTRVRRVEDLPSCNLMVRRSVLDEVGGFRTDFWPGEDTVLCHDMVRRGYDIYYDPRVLVYHHRRPLFGPHLRQVGRYALHRGFFARRFPRTSLRVAYMIPSLFVIGVVAGGLAAILSPVLRPVYLGALAVYGVTTALGSLPMGVFLGADRKKLKAWGLTWLGVMTTHVVYGIRFLAGLLARRMPETPQAFDHVSELTS